MMEPTRALLLVFMVTAYATIPSPMPLLLDVTEIQSTLLVAVHTQPVPLAATANVPPLAIPVSTTCDGESEKLQACIKLKTVPRESLPAAEVVPRKLVAEAWIKPASGTAPSLPPVKLYNFVNPPLCPILNIVPALLSPPEAVVP